MAIKLLILGCSSATPTSLRNPSAQLLNIDNNLFLIDCGEGTQMQLRRYKVKMNKIDNIFISHLHGDHYLGLMGLLCTFHLQGRTKKLNLFCHNHLKDILDLQFKVSDVNLSYSIDYHYLNFNKSEIIFENKNLTVETILLKHRIPTCGFLFKEKLKPRNIKKDVISKYDIPISELDKIKNGNDFIADNGDIIKNNLLTNNPPEIQSFAYCSDTAYHEPIIRKIKNVDMLYHEATFMHELHKIAAEKTHSTAIEAAEIAVKANVKKLIIGHYSARYDDLEPLLTEAKSVFNNTFLAKEGNVYEI